MKPMAFLIFAVFFLFPSCSSTIPDKIYSDNVQTSSDLSKFRGWSYDKNVNTPTKGTLGILPFKCEAENIGEVLSVETSKYIDGFNKIYHDEIQLMKRRTGKEIKELDIDYLLVGEIVVLSPSRRKFISGTVRIIDNKTDELIVRARFAPSSGRWKLQYVGEVLGTAVNREVHESF